MKLRSKIFAGMLSWLLVMPVMIYEVAEVHGSTPPLSGDSVAKEKSELLEDLFQLSGANDSYADLEGFFRDVGIVPKSDIPADRFDFVKNIIRRVNRAGDFKEIVKGQLLKNYNRNHVSSALKWYRSPLGMKIAQREKEFAGLSPTGRVYAGSEFIKNKPLEKTRIDMLVRLDKASSGTSYSIKIIQNLIRIMARDESQYQGKPIDALLMAVEKKIRPVISARVLGMSAHQHQDLTDVELKKFIGFSESKAGRWLQKATLAGADKYWGQVVVSAKDYQEKLYADVETRGEYGLLREFAPPGKRYAMLKKRDPFAPLIIDGIIQVTKKKKRRKVAKVSKYVKGYGREFRNTPNIPLVIFKKIEKDDPDLYGELESYAELFNDRKRMESMSVKKYKAAVRRYRSLIEQANGTKILPTPLQARYASLKLVGVVWKGSERVALIEIKGNKGHTVKQGVLMGPNYGVVGAIKRDEIVVMENSRDFLGNIVTNKKEIEFSERSQ